MALVPEGARLVIGPRTGTFGFAVSGLYVFPGVPFLLRDLTEAILSDFRAAPLCKAELITDLREGEIAPALREIQAASPDVAIGSYPVFGEGRWVVRVVLRGEAPGAVRVCEDLVRERLAALARGA